MLPMKVGILFTPLLMFNILKILSVLKLSWDIFILSCCPIILDAHYGMQLFGFCGNVHEVLVFCFCSILIPFSNIAVGNFQKGLLMNSFHMVFISCM